MSAVKPKQVGSLRAIGGFDDDVFILIAADDQTNTLKIANYCYNPSTLQWERMKQPTVEIEGDLTVTMGDLERLLNDHYYQRMKPYSYASGNIKYLCKNTDIDANETDTDWLIWKFTDADIPEKEGPRTGAVNTEAGIDGLGWNI